MKLTIEIELGNDAMQTPSEASHAIQKALAGGGGLALFEPIDESFEAPIWDENGNTVGTLRVEEDTA